MTDPDDLPQASGDPSGLPPDVPGTRDAAPLILIVDDHPGMRLTATRLLHHHGYRTAVACDGDEGVREALRLIPAAILLDIGMPNVDGFEVAQKLKGNEKTRSIPIIIVTAYPRDDCEEWAMGIGCTAFIQKPVQTGQLLAALRGAIPDRR